jgi:hypothetical protein
MGMTDRDSNPLVPADATQVGDACGLDPAIAVDIGLLEVEYLRLAAARLVPPTENSAAIRDLSPFGR